ncbi:MAG TPA: hypothetical protein VJG13_11080, partial [Thermoanaerobaculia bacterium]|nr:hypothetical protein [Thermoanaerobaculia bacterium]
MRELLQDPAPRHFQSSARLGQTVRLAPGGRRLLGEPFPAPLELGLPLAKLADRSGELRPLARGAHRVQAKGLEPFPVGQEPPPERSHLGLQRLHLSLPSALRGQELLQLALPGMPVGVETGDALLNQADFLFEPQ